MINISPSSQAPHRPIWIQTVCMYISARTMYSLCTDFQQLAAQTVEGLLVNIFEENNLEYHFLKFFFI